MSKEVINRCWSYKLYDFKDKDYDLRKYLTYMLNRTTRMFKYTNLPATIPVNMLEYYLQMNGTCCITEVNDCLYAFFGGWGGEPDAYYRPTTYTVANPALKFNKTLRLGEEAVLCYNDSRYQGLRSLFERYATQLVENDLSMYLADVQARVQSLMSAGDDRTRESAEKYLKNLVAGELGVIGDNVVLESFKTVPYTGTAHNSITDLIELQQYIKASWFNDLGLNANYNMKREAINSSEAQLGEDSLRPLVDDMLESRKEWVAQVNALYGTNIEVEYASSWKIKEVQDEQVEITPTTTEVETDTEESISIESEQDSSDAEGREEPEGTEGTEGTETTESSEGSEEAERTEVEEDRQTEDLEGEEIKPEEDKIIEVPVDDSEVEEAGGNEDVEG